MRVLGCWVGADGVANDGGGGGLLERIQSVVYGLERGGAESGGGELL